jgi:hypothetical protein
MDADFIVDLSCAILIQEITRLSECLIPQYGLGDFGRYAHSV